ncbi:MAG TPA: glycosyltransferase, partial [Acidimicrobiales bacterium]|nr:glycosyltransferase [Acidimicrobiales bacterium]
MPFRRSVVAYVDRGATGAARRRRSTRYLLLQPAFTGSPYDLSVDKGIIPTLLAVRYGWDVSIASQRATSLPTGLRSIGFGAGRLDSLRCIWRLAPNTDVLHLVGFNVKTIVRALVYKARNPRGVCYVRLGARTKLTELERLARTPGYGAILRLALGVVDLVSGESAEALSCFRRIVSTCRPRRPPETMLVPSCGYDTNAVLARLHEARDVQAEILFIGRVGAPLKATDILLAAFRRVRENCGVPARLHLVGPLESRFQEMFDQWSKQASQATRAAVSLVGPVWDRGALMGHYLRAKVFVICSRWEGGPNVFAEAASCGCLLVGTPVGQVPDVVHAAGGGWVVSIDDVGALADALAEAVNTTDSESLRMDRIRAFGRQYSWSAVMEALVGRLIAVSKAKGGRASPATDGSSPREPCDVTSCVPGATPEGSKP